MSISIRKFVLGPLDNNSYLLSDAETGHAVVIDPSFNSEQIIDRIQQDGLHLQAVWLTHGHFDHFAGASVLIHSSTQPVQLALHAGDLDLWRHGGEAPRIGFQIDLSAAPDLIVEHQQELSLGDTHFMVLHTPGHSAGHVTYFCPEIKAAFCGDLIFRFGIGRFDLTGGDYATLIYSLQTQILAMPPDTVLYSGHGKDSTVSEQIRSNPYLSAE